MTHRIAAAGLAVALSFLLAAAAGAESLLMSGHYDNDRGQINIPLGNNVSGTGFVSVTGTGTKKTIIVPTGVFVGGGMNTFPVPGNANVQQLFTSFMATAPAPALGSVSLKVGLTPSRPNSNFAYCPGMTVASCMDPRSSGGGAPNGSGTQVGLVRYTAGGLFGGTMRMLLQGSGALSNVIGLTPRFSHQPIGGSGNRVWGGAYANLDADYLPPGPITTGAVLSGNTASGGRIITPGVIITTASIGLSAQNRGFPVTTGSVYAANSLGPGGTGVPTQTGVGSHNTVKGRGVVTLVAGGISHDAFDPTDEGGAVLLTVTMDISSSQLTPALSPVGIAALTGLFVTAGGFMLRRSLASRS